MLTFSFDASGDENTPVLSVAGFASSEKDWSNFSERWTARLQKDGIEFFRAVDAAFYRGPFLHWHDKPNKEALRRALFSDLMDILKSCVYRKFGCSIINKAFGGMTPALKQEFALTAYSVAGRACEKKVREWILAEWKNHDMAIELVFEEGDLGKGKLQKRLDDDRCFSPTFRPKKDMISDGGIVRHGFIPLQAADWLAYELSVAMRNAENGKVVESTEELRWPLQEFFKIQGDCGVFTVEDMKQFEKMLELSKDLEKWWATLKS